MPISQMKKMSLKKDVLAQGPKNWQSQDLNPGLLTCIVPAPVCLTETLTCLHPEYTHPQPILRASWLIRKDEILQFATTWMDPENTISSEISQTESQDHMI